MCFNVRFYLLISLFFFSFEAFADKPNTKPKKKTVCLNMIVKNEAHVIKRCLESVLPLIDYWVIVDTGSTDGTQQVIKNFMKEKMVPGEVIERPWVNFAHNRTQAIELAKGKADYLLFIDADEYFVYEPDFILPDLDKDFYYIKIDCNGSRHDKTHLINNHLPWKWIGVLHEYVDSPYAKTHATLEKVMNIYTTEGARSKDPQKYQKDAQILEAALKEEPNNARYVYYLAQSYRCAGEKELALKNYEKLIEMGSWDQEVFSSMVHVGLLQEELKMPTEKIVESFYRAYNYRSSRAEPLYHLANFYRRAGNYAPGYLMASRGLTIPLSNDQLFVEKWMYDWGILLEFSICAHYVGRYDEAKQADLALLAKADLPQHVRECVESNMKFTDAKLAEFGKIRLPGFIPYTVLPVNTALSK